MLISRRSWPRPFPAAFTLFELLLVLGIMSLLLAMAWPAYDRMMEARRLTDGAGQVRRLLRQARRDAMGEGVPYRVTFLNDPPRVFVMPEVLPTEAKTNDLSTSEGESAAETYFEELPFGIRLIDAKEFEKGPREKQDDKEELPASDDSDVQEGEERKPEVETAAALVTFLPDGSADEVTLWMVDEQRRAAPLWVNGLTGDVGIGEVEDWLTPEAREERDRAEHERLRAGEP